MDDFEKGLLGTKIFAAWLIGSIAACWLLLRVFQPLAGLAAVFLILALLSATVMPVVHFVMRLRGVPRTSIAAILATSLAVVACLLAVSGLFNFA